MTVVINDGDVKHNNRVAIVDIRHYITCIVRYRIVIKLMIIYVRHNTWDMSLGGIASQLSK